MPQTWLDPALRQYHWHILALPQLHSHAGAPWGGRMAAVAPALVLAPLQPQIKQKKERFVLLLLQ